jgi:hypothetical protein
MCKIFHNLLLGIDVKFFKRILYVNELDFMARCHGLPHKLDILADLYRGPCAMDYPTVLAQGLIN